MCEDIKLNDEVIKEVNKYKSSEDLLRAGGISVEALDRLAFGFSDDDIKTISPNKLKIKWKEDLKNVKFELEFLKKKTPNIPLKKIMFEWAKTVDLSEPIDVSYEKDGFYIEDGHHRFFAAKILGKELNVDLTIKSNPILKIAPKLSYDDFHRCIFNQIKNL